MSGPDLNDQVEAFRQALMASPYAPADAAMTVIDDGQIHQYERPGDAQGTPSGYYLLTLIEDTPTGCFGSRNPSGYEAWQGQPLPVNGIGEDQQAVNDPPSGGGQAQPESPVVPEGLDTVAKVTRRPETQRDTADLGQSGTTPSISGRPGQPAPVKATAEPGNLLEVVIKELAETIRVDAHGSGQGPGSDYFRVGPDGVFYHGHGADGQALPPVWVCSPLVVGAYTRNRAKQGWGRLLYCWDPEGTVHKWSMPMEMLRGEGAEYRGALLDLGVCIAHGLKPRTLLSLFLQSAQPERTVICEERTGWAGEVFVLPHRTIGRSDQWVIYQSSTAALNPYCEQGGLVDWKSNVASLCPGNSRLTFGMSTGFLGPLLPLLNEASRGYHFYGSSSTGKTTIAKAVASVWGGPELMRTWRATANGLEGVAQVYSGTTLPLDEIGQARPEEVAAIVYMIADGRSKLRANREGRPRKAEAWCLAFISTGEHGLEQYLKSGGEQFHAGQGVRLPNIPVDAGAGYGAFESLHDETCGAAFADRIAQAAATYYGTAGPTFVEYLAQDLGCSAEMARALRDQYRVQILPTDADGQVQRIAAGFAAVAAAGEMATRFGITGWPEGEAIRAATICFAACLESRGGAGNHEPIAILEQVKGFFERHGESRFTPILKNGDSTGSERLTINRAGFRRLNSSGEPEYLVLPQVFKEEICAGRDARAVARLLLEHGWLVPGGDGKPSRSERLPGLTKTTRCYVFNARIWEGA